MNFETLEIGQEVGYNAAPGWTHNYKLGLVAKITKTQLVLESGHRFNKQGHELKSDVNSHPRAVLCSAETVRSIRDRKELQHKTDASVDALLAEINGNRTGTGHYHISEADKAALLAKVAALVVNGQ